MKEARIVLPFNRMHPRNHEAHAGLRAALVEAFGGYTSYKGQGGWKDPATGKVIDEDVRVYDVAYGGTVAEMDAFNAAVTAAGCMLDQKCVYLRGLSGHVYFVDIDCTQTEIEADHARMDDDGAAQEPIRVEEHLSAAGHPRYEHKLPNRPGAQPLGTKQLPQVGEIWETANGGRAAVTGMLTTLDGAYSCVLIEGGTSSLSAGYLYSVNLDGAFGYGGTVGGHPFDLKRYVGLWR